MNRAELTANAIYVPDTKPQNIPRKQLFAAMVGNIFEYYDFGIFALMASFIATNFYQGDNVSGLLASFATFGVGFLARPLGGLLIGRIADKKGRKVALRLTIYGMAIGTVGIGLLPTYDSVGIWAPLALVVIRLIQGLAAGGEWGTATTFIVESAPQGKRGLYGSYGQMSITAAIIATSGVVALFTFFFSPEQMNAWAWRIPFLLGAFLLVVGVYMRKNLEETPAFIEAKQKKHKHQITPIPRKQSISMMAKAFGFATIWTVSFYVMLQYMPTFLNKQVGLTQTQALTSNVLALVVLCLTMPFFGWLSDRIGRKPLLLACCLFFIIMPYPLFNVMLQSHSVYTVLTIQIVCNLFISAFSGAAPATLCEIFPTSSRTMQLSIGYGLATAVFGGFAPFISTWLIDITNTAIAPVYYLMLAGVISAFSILRLKETVHESLN